MEKIYLIELSFHYQDGAKKDWSPNYGLRDYKNAVKDIKKMITEERENRKIRKEKYGNILYKVYYRIQEIHLY